MLKKITISLIIFSAVAAIVFGSYLPFRKSQLFIKSFRGLGSMEQFDFDKFRSGFDQALDFYSPVGQSEEVRFLGNQILELMQRKPPENTREALKSYAVNNFEGTKGKWLSLNYTQNFLILGAIHQAAWSESKSQEDLDKTIYYFEEGLKLSPERAQFLFGLFELYRWANRNADAEKVIRKIAELWPSSVTEQPKTAN